MFDVMSASLKPDLKEVFWELSASGRNVEIGLEMVPRAHSRMMAEV